MKRKQRSILAIMIAVILSLNMVMIPGEAYASGEIPNPDETIDVDGDWAGTLYITENKTVKLSNLTHDSNGTTSGSAICISGDVTVNLVIEGNVTLKGNIAKNAAGIEVAEGSTLNLYGVEGSSLTVVGGKNGAGIGGIGYDSASETNPSAGKVNIYSGNITASGGAYGAGIGSGYHSSASEINIYGGNITAIGGKLGGAGIGSGYGSSGGADSAKVGFYHGGNISISGGTIQATGGTYAAGIGGGYGASSGNITIEGDAMVTATGSVGGAGIGTGKGTSKLTKYDATNSFLDVSIRGSATVIASATKDDRANQHPAGGAGIGFGRGFNDDNGSIKIEGNASVSASTETCAAAIGGGVMVKSISESYSPNPEDFAKPTITIASTTKITSSNDGSVPAVNGSNMHSMSHEVTFKVTNGFWKDGKSDDIKVTAEGYEGEGYSVKLSDGQIPDVGNNPADGFRTGDWDTKPSVDTELTGDTTYTYSYVAKVNPKVTPPAAKTGLVFNGSAQALVTAGSTDGGTMMYALGANATTKPAESAYTASIPANTKAGTYYVWYMVKGDDNYFGTEPKCITVTIAEPEDESGDSNDKDTPAGVDTDEVNPGIDEDSTDPDSSKDDKEQADPSDNNDDVDPTSNSDSQKKIKDNFSNEWVDGKWYSSDGSQTYEPRGRWEQDGKGWYYIDESGWYPESMWQKIDSDWYYFDEEGYMATNQYCGSWDTYTKGFWWVGADGCWDGSACAIWHMTDGTWWFGDSDGWYAHNGWLMINRKWYYFDSDGWMLSNRWIGSWYVGEDGALEE